jgi:hypothetical protein
MSLPRQVESLHAPQVFERKIGEGVRVRVLAALQAGAAGALTTPEAGAAAGSVADRARGAASNRAASINRAVVRCIISLLSKKERV